MKHREEKNRMASEGNPSSIFGEAMIAIERSNRRITTGRLSARWNARRCSTPLFFPLLVAKMRTATGFLLRKTHRILLERIARSGVRQCDTVFPITSGGAAATSVTKTEGDSLNGGKARPRGMCGSSASRVVFIRGIGPAETSTFYHHWEQDIALLKQLKHNSFSHLAKLGAFRTV